ncbi:unnamed protein product [Choristocarpus tenellus]
MGSELVLWDSWDTRVDSESDDGTGSRGEGRTLIPGKKIPRDFKCNSCTKCKHQRKGTFYCRVEHLHLVAPDCDSTDQETPWSPPEGFFTWLRTEGYVECKTDEEVYQLALDDPWQLMTFPWHRAAGGRLEDPDKTRERDAAARSRAMMQQDASRLPWISRKGVGSSGFGGPGRPGLVGACVSLKGGKGPPRDQVCL